MFLIKPKTILTTLSLLAIVLSVATFAQPVKTYAAVDGQLQSILSQDICPKLKKIKHENMSKKYCKSYSSQSKLDAAVAKICDKYGKRSPQKLYMSCKSYSSAKSSSSDSSIPRNCNPGTDPTCALCDVSGAKGCVDCSGNKCLDNSADPNANCDKEGCDLIKKYVNPAVDLLALSFGLIATGSLIMGGIQYAASAGEAQKVSEAKQRISKTLFAIAAFFFLYAFVQFLIPGGAF